MSEKFVIHGKKELRGEIEVRGSKNAAGPILAATVLTDEKCVIQNIPKISDILNLLQIIESMGKKIDWLAERTVSIEGGDFDPGKLNFEKVSRARVSVLLLGALLPRFREFKFSRPGGDRIGLRPINIHLEAFKKLGAEISESGNFYNFKNEKLSGAEITLPEFSVTATENIIMAATLSEGETVIKGAAQEPHVENLIESLRLMGAAIETIGGNKIKLKGKKSLKGGKFEIIPDANEAGTFILFSLSCGRGVTIKNIEPEHLDLFLLKLKEMGARLTLKEKAIEVSAPLKFKAIRVQALPYAGFPTDLLPLIVPVLTQAEGKSAIHDPLYENRLNYVHELRKMGADIDVVDPHRAFVFGPTPLFGTTVESRDIRAGASLVEAGLLASGETIIENIFQIDRGHEKLEERLQKIGADIKRVKN